MNKKPKRPHRGLSGIDRPERPHRGLSGIDRPAEPNKRADFVVETHGSIYLLRPMNDRAKQWLKENVDSEPYMYFGQALAVERRYISEIVRGAIEDGYIVI